MCLWIMFLAEICKAPILDEIVTISIAYPENVGGVEHPLASP